MLNAAFVARVIAPAEWIVKQIAARPKTALVVWILSLALVAWVF